MTKPDPTLLQHRAEIDAIDDQLLSLLARRISIVQQVGVLKRSQDPEQCFLRAGREADMVRTIAAKGAGKFPPEALAGMWRMLISGSLNIEQPFTVSAVVSKDFPNGYWLAREYFGGFVPVYERSSSQEALDDLREKKSLVAALPAPDADNTWWTTLLNASMQRLKIFAIAPFVVPRTKPEVTAWLVGGVTPEASIEDTSLIAAEGSVPTTWRVLSHANVTGNNITLYSTPGFLTEAELPAGARLLGSYANPIQLEK